MTSVLEVNIGVLLISFTWKNKIDLNLMENWTFVSKMNIKYQKRV